MALLFFFGGNMRDLVAHCFFEENMTVEEIAKSYDLEVEDVKEILQAYWKRER